MKSKLVAKTNFVCQSCGFESSKWLGKCPSCGGWNSFVEEARRADLRPRNSKVKSASYGDSKPRMLDQISLADRDRMRTGIAEFDRVTGGGVVPGSLLLVGGDPGIGKSTLTLQLMQALARDRTVLYVSGEESLEQIKLRADRLGVSSPNILLLAETALESILPAIEDARPDVVVIDSIQTMYRADLESAPGSVGQVRECGAELMRLAKQRTVATFLIGHVTKEGVIAGPRTLEHMVDTVLYLEGERHHAYRILRSVKNRFGSTNEIGVFEMREQGLAEVANPSRIFLSERSAGVPGSVVVCSLEGTRPLLVEIQALVTPTSFGVPQRNTTGFNHRRLAMLLAVLERRAGLNLGMHDVFVNVAGGLRLEEPAADLGVACAIASAFKNRAADAEAVLVGEVGLGGEVRSVGQLEKRTAEAAKLGFRKVIGPFAGFAPANKVDVTLVTAGFLADAIGAAIR